MATMKEIAQLAGVSRGTVDRVLNHRGAVNEDTKKKVLEIAELLKYQPNKAGIALAAQKKKLKIGILLFGIENPFFDEVLQGLHEKAAELSIYGCTILEKQIPYSLDAQLSAIEELLKEDIHGLILSPYNDPLIQEKIDALFDAGIPCVTLNTDISNSRRLTYVGSDFQKCGQIAGELLSLFTKDSAKIGIITGSNNVLCHEERIAGFRHYLTKTNSSMQILDIAENEDDDYKSFDVTKSFLEKYPDMTALYFTAGGVYGGCRAVLHEKKERALSIVTFDSVPSTIEMLRHNVISATITQQPKEQGALSLSILMDYLLYEKHPDSDCSYMELSIKTKECF